MYFMIGGIIDNYCLNFLLKILDKCKLQKKNIEFILMLNQSNYSL